MHTGQQSPQSQVSGGAAGITDSSSSTAEFSEADEEQPHCSSSSTAVSSCASGGVLDAATSRKPARAAAAAQRQLPAWKQRVQQEKQLARSQHKQAAAHAAAAAKQHRLAALAANWELAQQQLPFHVQHSQVSTRVQHKLQKTLSTILNRGAAPADDQCTAEHQPALYIRTDTGETPCCSSGGALVRVTPEPKAQETRGSPKHAARSSSGAAGQQLRASEHCLQGKAASSSEHGLASPQGSCRSARVSKQQAWASADAATDAEVDGYLLAHWQQQHLVSAALVLQCAWRSRVARLAFGRYLSKRHSSVHATVQPAFQQWHFWSKAAAHHRRKQQQAVLHAWRELLQLQLQFCSKVLRALQRGVLSGDMPALYMWRLCSSSSGPQATSVRPSLGGMVAAVLLHKVPQMRQQECFKAWQQLCQSQAALRARALRMLAAVLSKLQRQQILQAIRFWRMFTACSICERLQLQLPAFPYSCDAFDAWLWHHEQQLQLRQQADVLAVRLGVLRYFVCWHGHVHKLRVMRAAWSGLLLHTPEELLWCGLSAFKANWREQQLHRRLLTEAVVGWRELAQRNKAVAAVRTRIKQVAESRRKTAGLSAFVRFRRMSQLLSAAAVLKQWHARPLLLAHMHAWMHDTLHASFYLCWWRWRNKALARLRWRAALGMHMYRAHWLQLELAFAGWRKAACMSRLDCQQRQQQQQKAEEEGRVASAASAEDGCNEATAPGTPGTVGQGGVDAAAPPAPQTPEPATAQLLSTVCTDALSEQQQQQQQSQGDCGSDTSGCSDPDGAKVHVSLADSSVGHTWRPLLQRKAVLAPQGLARLTGLRLGRAVRDLRELEGGFILKDSGSSGAGGLLSARVFARPPVSAGLKAMAIAQPPMHILWRTCFLADKYWWQRVVGLVEHRQPHPDSWRALLTPQQPNMHSSSCSSTDSSDSDDSSDGSSGCNSQQVCAAALQDFLDPSNSSAAYKCTCSRCPWHVAEQATAAAEVEAKPVLDAAALVARARSRLRAGLCLQPLQVPEAAGSSPAEPSSCSSSTAAAAVTTEVSSIDPSADERCGGGSEQTGNSSRSCSARVTCGPAAGASSTHRALGTSRTCSRLSSAGSGSDCDLWPVGWTCEDVAGLCRLVQAEELLETAVHLLLGVGADSTAELYDKLRQTSRGLELQGDLLAWLLSAAFAHDHAISQAALSRMRARDELRLATLQLQERAMALHLHIPYKFTLSRNRACVDVRASWAAIIAKIEQERDWDASSVDEDAEPREQLWVTLLAQQHQQQQQQQFADQVPATAPELQGDSALPLALQQVLRQLPQHMQAQQTASQPALAMVLAAASSATAGPLLGTASRQLAPGNMLTQTTPAYAGEAWRAPAGSQPQTPRTGTHNKPQVQLQQQLDAQQQAAMEQQHKEQQKAQLKQQRQQKHAMAAAQGLFGRNRSTAAAAVAAQSAGHGVSGQQLQAVGRGMAPAADEEFFGGPAFLPVASLSGTAARASSATGGLSSSTAGGASMPAARAASPSSSSSALQQQQQPRPTKDAHAAAASAGGAQAVTGSSPGAAAVVGRLGAAATAPGTQAAAAEALYTAEQQTLQTELEGVLTELLTPVLELAPPAADADAGDGGDTCTAESSNLQEAKTAATRLASACAKWVLQAAQHEAASFMAPRPTCKPHSAPGVSSQQQHFTSNGLQGGLSSCSSGSVGRPGSSGEQVVDSSSTRRAASASADLRPTRRAAAGQVTWGPIPIDATCDTASTAAAAAAAAAFLLNHPAEGRQQQQQVCAVAGLGVSTGQQDASWAELAVAQGLLDPSYTAVAGLLSQQQQEMQVEGAAAGASDLGGQGSQVSTQEESCCSSSLPSIPSARGFWAYHQQLQAGGTRQASNQAAPVASVSGPVCQAPAPASGVAFKEGRLLPPIGPAAHLAQSQQGTDACAHSGGSKVPCQVQTQGQQQGSAQHQQAQGQQQQQVLAALQALHSQCQPCQQPGIQTLQSQEQQQLQHVLAGLQQALTGLQPTQLQQQVQHLLELQQRQRADTLHQQQHQHHQLQELGIAPILPWGGELQPPAADVLHGAAAHDTSNAAGVLATLLGASLSTRVAFWQQHAAPGQPQQQPHGQQQQQQQLGAAGKAGSSSLSDQLHQLAWSSLLLSAAVPRGQRQQQDPQQPHAGVQQCDSPAEPMTALRQKLQTYLSAHVQWRQQRQYAPPLAPAEKWITLQHEEQVLEFITSMTIAVHQALLRKHQGLSPAGQQQQAVAFGSRTVTNTTTRPAAAEAAAAAAALQAQPALAAAGSRVQLAQSGRLVPTVPRQPPVRLARVYVVPRPQQQGQQTQPSPRQLGAYEQERLEPLAAWTTTDDYDTAGHALPALQHVARSTAGPGAQAVGVDQGLQCRDDGSCKQLCDSFASSDSSWHIG